MIYGLKKDIDREIKQYLSHIRKKYKLHLVSDLLFSGIEDFLKREGKRIRSTLMIISYLGYTKKRKIRKSLLLRSAVSLEFLHAFLLAHDDIIDRSSLRRGKPALHKYYEINAGALTGSEIGNNLALVAGDIIFAFAIDSFLAVEEDPLRKEKGIRRLIDSTIWTGAGEFIDVIGESRDLHEMKLKDVFSIYTLKTARYTFEGPLLIGAELAGAGKKELERLSGLGITLGRAFQIADDLLDIFLTSKETGKPALSDLAESKKTLLVLKTYENLRKKDQKTFHRLFNKKKKTKSELLCLKRFIKDSDAPEYCMKNAKTLLKKSSRIIAALKIRKRYKEGLNGVVSNLGSKIELIESRI